MQRLERIDGVTDIHSPLNAADRADTVSEDGRSVVVNFSLPDADEDEAKLIEWPRRPSPRSPRSRRRIPSCASRSTAAPPAPRALQQEAADEAKSMQLSFGGTLIILLLAFGAMVAAGVPLFLGLTSVFATIGLLGPVSQISGLHPAVARS